jgi:DNA-binding MarR family transcriptional regulator
MAHGALAMIVYQANPAVCVFGDSAAARERMRRTAEAAGCHIARSATLGAGAAPQCVPAAAALIELDGIADEAAVVALLDWAQHEAASGARRVVVSAPAAWIDLVAARTPDHRVAQLCAAPESERISEVALASRPPGAELNDVGRDEGSAILQQLTEDVSRIAAILSSLSEDEQAAIASVKPADGADKDEPGIDAAFVRSVIRARRMRDQYFRGGLFADPAWDMLLDLMAARLEENRVAVSSLCIAAAVPATTALRWIKALTDRGLFVRSADPQDGRRVYIELSDDAARALTAYLRAVHRMAPTAIDRRARRWQEPSLMRSHWRDGKPVSTFPANARNGRLAQLVEHLVYTERVGGSSPSPPTSRRRAAVSAGKPATVGANIWP